MGHEEFAASCVHNLRERTEDECCEELLTIGFDCNELFQIGLATFKGTYETVIREHVLNCLKYGVTHDQISTALDSSSSLAKIHQLLKEKEFQVPLDKISVKENFVGESQYHSEIALESASFTSSVGEINYQFVGSSLSQYNLGAISACTNMALQAVYECLNAIQGTKVPYGCTNALLVKILQKGAEYQGRNHLDILEVIRNRPELMRDQNGLHQFSGMVDLQPNQPEKGVNQGRVYMDQIRGHIGCVITCQAQSLSLIYVYQANQFIVFDSHSREHNRKMYGACFLFFNSFVDVCLYIKKIFPNVDQPDIRMQSLEEQLQYAHLSVGQADFFCLRSLSEQSLRRSNLSSPSPLSTYSMVPPQLPPAALPSFPSTSTATSKSTTVIGIHMAQFDRIVQFHRQQMASVNEIQQSLHTLSDFSHQHLLQDELRRLREEVETTKRSSARSKHDCELFEEKITHQQRIFLEHQNEINRLRKEIASERHSLLTTQEHLKPLATNQLHPFDPSPSHREEIVADKKYAEMLQQQEDENVTRKKLENDYKLVQDKLIADMKYAKQLQQEESENERRLQLAKEIEREQEERARQIEADLKIAQNFYFDCCICLDPEVHIEEKFDLEHDNHAVCRNCATNYLRTNLQDRHIPIKCMFTGCTKDIHEAKCFEVLNVEEQIAYFHLSGRPTSDPKFRQCPKPDCRGFDIPIEEDCTCSICNHHWCSYCQVDLNTSQHTGISCERYQQWKKDNDQGDEAMEKFLRTGLSDIEGADRMRRCPNCRMPYMKDQACSHVVCTSGCGVHFCFRCAKFHANNAQAIYNHQSSCAGYQVEP